ncbi:hypothetical protein MKX03_014905 [Papaver bracteatum]|nr:hypothetical protein MKX03_014905 [Papaver bracteatum]
MRGTVVDKLTEETLRDWSHVQELLSACEGNHGQPMSCFYSMVKSGTMFDNVLVCYDPDYAKKLAEETRGKQKEGEKAAFDEELELCLGFEDDTTFEKQSAPFALVISHFVLINM